MNEQWIRMNEWQGSGVSDGKESPCNVGDPGSLSGLERSPGEGNGNPIQYSCPENSMDRGAYSPQGCKESDTTEQLILTHTWMNEWKAYIFCAKRIMSTLDVSLSNTSSSPQLKTGDFWVLHAYILLP